MPGNGNPAVTTRSDTNPTKSRTVSRRNMLKSLGAGAIAVGFAGCSGGGGDDKFKIGVNMELSQGQGLLGGSIVDNVKLRTQKINENGGLAGKEIELIVEDNQVDPKVARQKAEKLIQQDNVDMLFGPINTSERVPISGVVEQYEVPLLYPTPYEGTAAPDYCNPYLLKTGQTPTQQVKPLIPWLVENYGDKFYFLGNDYTWPHELNKIGRNELEKLGGEVVGEEYASMGTTEFSSIIPKIQNADPDVLFMDLVGASVGAIQKQMHNRGVRGQFKEVGLAHGPAVLDGVPAEATKGVINSQAYYQTLPNEANQQFMKEYKEFAGENAFQNYISGSAYVAMGLLEKAIENAGGTSTEDIFAGFEDVSIEKSIAGPVSMGHDQQAKLQTKVGEINDQKLYDIVAYNDPVLPPETCDNI